MWKCRKVNPQRLFLLRRKFVCSMPSLYVPSVWLQSARLRWSNVVLYVPATYVHAHASPHSNRTRGKDDKRSPLQDRQTERGNQIYGNSFLMLHGGRRPRLVFSIPFPPSCIVWWKPDKGSDGRTTLAHQWSVVFLLLPFFLFLFLFLVLDPFGHIFYSSWLKKASRSVIPITTHLQKILWNEICKKHCLILTVCSS